MCRFAEHSISVVVAFLVGCRMKRQSENGAFAVPFTTADNVKNIEKQNSFSKIILLNNLIIYLLFDWLKASMLKSFLNVSSLLISFHPLLFLQPVFFPGRLRMVLLLMYLKMEGSRAFLFSSPPRYLVAYIFPVARFIVRKISSVAAVACSIQVSFSEERGSTVTT